MCIIDTWWMYIMVAHFKMLTFNVDWRTKYVQNLFCHIGIHWKLHWSNILKFLKFSRVFNKIVRILLQSRNFCTNIISLRKRETKRHQPTTHDNNKFTLCNYLYTIMKKPIFVFPGIERFTKPYSIICVWRTT